MSLFIQGGISMSLLNIQATVQEVSEVIAVVLGVEVTIIDENCKRVAASGNYKDYIGKRIPSNSIFEKVIKDKATKCICQYQGCSECHHCSAETECTELATIGYPIINNEKLLGVIGINAFKEEQKIKLIENKDSLMKFLEKISGMLGVTSSYFDTMQKLQIQSVEINKLIEDSSRGIICIDKDRNLKFSNKKAREILDIEENDQESSNLKRIISELDLYSSQKRQREVKIIVRNKKTSFLVKSEPVTLNKEQVSTLIEINKTADIIRDAYNLFEVKKQIDFDSIIGTSEVMKKVKYIAQRVSQSNSTVLIRGESGTGKELFARAIHFESLRNNAPFIAINCASIPDNLLESELFGYEGGAFSGARKEGQMGKFELANGGTVFLDEIGDMPLHLQPKILRVLQERCFTKVGGKENINVDIRLIAATHKNLEDMIKNGEFREDLYYRLNVIPVCLPSLKERREDILILAEHLLDKYCQKLEKEQKFFSKEIENIFLTYPWPGNIREMENIIEYAVNISKSSSITIEDLPPTMREKAAIGRENVDNMDIRIQLEKYEKNILENMLERHGRDTDSKMMIADMLNINLSTLYRKLTKYKLS